MNKRLVIAVLTALITVTLQTAKGQEKIDFDKLYVAAGIPDSLKEEADAVVRYADKQITLRGPGLQRIKYHSVVTILNEKGDKEAMQILGYNKKYDTYSYVDMKIYDAAGKLIKKYHKSDMYDRSASDDETIVTDDRMLAVRHVVSSYPTTVDLEYEEDITSSLSLESWYIQPSYRVAIQKSRCHVAAAPALNFRYKNKNISLQPVATTAADYNTYSWEVNNLKAIDRDEDVLSWQVLPRVLFTTDRFSFYGNAGSMTSWQSFGDWIQQLNLGGTELSSQRAEEIRKMTDTIKTDKAKARFLYSYMQKNMRYISIQLGIGGFKPFSADFVDQKRYGDCKALSNYMAALLKAVHIPSYYALIRAGANEEPADPEFPYNSFNHAILCIPLKGDTTWLECTSNTMPFGKLGSFTENRNALLITENGGKLVNTPKSLMADNQMTSTVHLTLNADGGAKAQVKMVGTGGYQEYFTGLLQQKPDDQKEIFIRSHRIKQPSAFNISEGGKDNSTKEVDLELEYDKFCDIMSGDKQFYSPRVFDLWSTTLPANEKRKKDFYFEHPMQKSCITVIDLPAGYEAESVPTDVKLSFDYGIYTANYTYDKAKNQVTSTVKFNMTTQVIPAKKYGELHQYLDNIQKAQSKKLVIHRKAA
jgi:hypothetical protein